MNKKSVEEAVLRLHFCHGSRGSSGKERERSEPYLSYVFKEFQSHQTDLCGQLLQVRIFVVFV